MVLNCKTLPRNLRSNYLKDIGDTSALLIKLDVPHDCSAEWIGREKTKQDTACLVCKVCCLSHSARMFCRTNFCGLETKQSPLNIIMEKLPEENTKKDIVVNLWFVRKKPVREYRGGC